MFHFVILCIPVSVFGIFSWFDTVFKMHVFSVNAFGSNFSPLPLMPTSMCIDFTKWFWLRSDLTLTHVFRRSGKSAPNGSWLQQGDREWVALPAPSLRGGNVDSHHKRLCNPIKQKDRTFLSWYKYFSCFRHGSFFDIVKPLFQI